MIKDLFLWEAPSPVLAKRQAQSAFMPLVIHIFDPSMT